jgi:hypothetical protein
LTFYDQSGTDPSDLTPIGSDNVVITTTSNQYTAVTDPTTDQLNTDADFVNVCGPLSSICGQSLEAYEADEVPGFNGFITVDLYGTVAGDPQLSVTSASITAGNGIVGTEAPLAAVPEPSSLLLLLTALLGGIGMEARRRSLARIRTPRSSV